MLARGLWTPDEPREADISWRMSWQPEKAVPLLAGEAFCEKPPLAYWLAAIPIRIFGSEAWAARLPNLLYALITALAVGLLARRSAGRFAALVGAAAISTFLLAYQVAIWLATDAPLLATVSVALLGTYIGFYATSSRERLRGYLLMHAALGLGFLSKSAAAWMVPVLAILTLVIWEKRWRELLRWELYVGLLLQAAMILVWIWFVYTGPDGRAHLKIFFWNNLLGRFTKIDAPHELQYATAHLNSPGKYLIELPLYLCPWTLLVAAAARRAWRQRRASFDGYRAVRFALAVALPPLAILSVAATARNIYYAPALPGAALLLAWWAREAPNHDRWDVRALRATSVMLLLAVAAFAAAVAVIGVDAWNTMATHASYVVISLIGLLAAAILAVRAWAAARTDVPRALWSLLLAYCVLLVAPASQVYGRVDAWQNLAAIGHAMEHDAAGRPLILFAPDETTRAMIDMYARTTVDLVPGPIDDAALQRLRAAAALAPRSRIVVQLPGHSPPANPRLARYFGSRQSHSAQHPSQAALPSPAASAASAAPTVQPAQAWRDALPWLDPARLQVAKTYSLPNGRRYALLELIP